MRKILFLVVLVAVLSGCASRTHRARLPIPPPMVPNQDTMECFYESRRLSRFSLTPPLERVIAHNNNYAYVLFKVDGCRVVEKNAEGRLIQLYTLPGQTKTFDFWAWAQGGEQHEIRADAFCPVPPSYQVKTEREPVVYIPGTHPPTPPATVIGCVEGQYLGTDYTRVYVYSGGGYDVKSWEINYPNALKVGMR